jgi:hypothetical protein
MKCQKCGASSSGDSAFCSECGAKLSKEVHSEKEEAPAEQAEQVVKRFKSIVGKFGFGEKLVGAGAIVGLISFFLPWISFDKYVARDLNLPQSMSGAGIGGWMYLLPILMAGILVLLYFSMGSPAKTKIKRASYYLVIGTVFETASITALILTAQISHWLSQSGAPISISDMLTFAFGWWLVVLANLAIIAGAFLIQKAYLKE